MISTNQNHGFFGEMSRLHDAAFAADAFAKAAAAIAAAADVTPEVAGLFLDSRSGRHFADDVVNADALGTDAAIAHAIGKWMEHTVSRRLSRETGIPQGLPLLVGLCVDAEITDEATSARQ